MKPIRRRLICLLLCAALFLGAMPAQSFAAEVFTDISDGQYYYAPVLWAVNHVPQITNGVDSAYFAPATTCTRGQVVTFLWRAAGE